MGINWNGALLNYLLGRIEIKGEIRYKNIVHHIEVYEIRDRSYLAYLSREILPISIENAGSNADFAMHGHRLIRLLENCEEHRVTLMFMSP